MPLYHIVNSSDEVVTDKPKRRLEATLDAIYLCISRLGKESYRTIDAGKTGWEVLAEDGSVLWTCLTKRGAERLISKWSNAESINHVVHPKLID